MTIHNATRDLTAFQRTVHVGHTPLFSWVCGHKAKRAGGFVTKTGAFLRCALCGLRAGAR